MFLFGHLGIGKKIVSPWSMGLPLRPLLLGTILPDLIDKPLYYGLVLATGKHGAELGFFSGTRTIGHTGVFLLLITFYAMIRRSKVAAAIALGVASHLLLDNVGDRLILDPHHLTNAIHAPSSALVALVWPFLGLSFSPMPFHDFREHLRTVQVPFILWAEVIGIGLLSWDTWKDRHQNEILLMLRMRRLQRKRRLRHRTRRNRPVSPETGWDNTL